MATRAIERVKVTLGDGVERTLRYTIAAMREAREEFGGSITDMETLNGIEIEKTGKLLWYGLRADQPELTPEGVDELLEPPMLVDVMQQYRRAVSVALPEKNELGPAELLAQAAILIHRAETIAREMNQTGSPSGHSDDSTSASQNENSGNSHSENSEHSLTATTSN